MYRRKEKIRKIVPLVLATAMAASIITGCKGTMTQKEEIAGVTVNEEFNEKNTLWTVSGGKAEADNELRIIFANAGMGIITPGGWVSNSSEMTFWESEQGYDIGVILPSKVRIPYVRLLYAKDGKAMEEIQKENQEYQKLDKIVSFKGNTYYMAYNETLDQTSNPQITEEDIQYYKKMADEISKVKKDLIIIPPVKSKIGDIIDEKLLKKMKAKDMEGNEVTADIFKKYDITAVNIWATWCSPCVKELPDIAKLYKELPENANIISVCMDGKEESDTAKEVLKTANAEFVTIKGDAKLRDGVFGSVISFPTTVFIDKEGKVIGEPFISSGNKETYRALIEEKLNAVKQKQEM